MENRYMRLIVMFDLPVTEASERKAATKFRNYLLKQGYQMLQYSIYYRIVNGFDMRKKFEKQLQYNLPSRGSIRLLVVSEKQFESMNVLVGYKTPIENKINDDSLVTF